jgi:hypothetical protein
MLAIDTKSGMHGQQLAKLTSDHAAFTLNERTAELALPPFWIRPFVFLSDLP